MVDAVPPSTPSVYPPPPPVPRRGRAASFWVAIVLGVILVGSMLVNLLLVAAVGAAAVAAGGDQPGRREWGEKPVTGDGHDKIALIELRGVITSNRGEGMFGDHQSLAERIESQLAQARRDERVKAVVLAIESPGGEVTASDALHDQVEKVREAGKPVVVHMGAVCASGGYYVAAPADVIVAAPTGLTGSIGVIFETPDLHRLLDEKLGIGFNVMKSGAFKDIGSPMRPMRDDERALLQGLVDENYQRFVRVVARGRAGRGPIPKDEEAAFANVKALADGRIYSGEQALKLGLADALGHVEAAYAKARELAHSPDATIVRYRRAGGFLDLLSADGEAKVNVNAGVQVDAGVLRAATTPRMEYRWAPEIAAP